MIEVTTFRLVAGTEEAEFLAADARVQSDFAYQQPDLVRRTTARSAAAEGEWIVIELWGDVAAADAAATRREGDAAVQAFLAFVDATSVTTRRYTELD